MRKLIKPVIFYILFDILFTVAGFVALALLPYFTQKLINGYIISALIGYITCIVLYISLFYIGMIIEWKEAIIFSNSLKNSWYDALQKMPHSDFKNKSVPEYISYQSNDLDALEKDYLPPLISLIKQIIRIVVFSIIIIKVVNISVAGILFVCSLLSILIPKILGKRIAMKRSVYLNEQGKYYDKIDDLLSAHHLINVDNIDNITTVQRISLKSLQEKYFKYGLTKTLGISLTAFSIKITDIILFIYLAYAISHNEMTVAHVVASLSYINSFSEPLHEILYDIQMLESINPIKLSFLKIINGQFDEKIPVYNFKNITLKNIYKEVGNITLNIPFLSIDYGEKIAVIGENGAGKSTFLNILNGVDSQFEGEVSIDGTLAKNLDGLFGKIIQKEHAFKSSYEDNISTFKSYPIKVFTPEFSLKQGHQLSGGEQQRMFIEREINRNSPLIIMDEPFSALDKNQLELQLDKILSLDNTIIMTIHQNGSLLHKFSQVWRLVDGNIYVENVKKANKFIDNEVNI